MARNRRRTGPNAAVVAGRLVRAVPGTMAALLPALLLGGFVAGAGYLAHGAVLDSPYFTVRHVEYAETPSLDRAQILARVGLDRPVHLLQFDAPGAEARLLLHPRVARAEVTTRLPDAVTIHVDERRAAAVAVLGDLYVVDATGHAFARARPDEVEGLPLLTGLSRAQYDADPDGAAGRLLVATSLARLYAVGPLAAVRPLSNVHLGDDGGYELMLGRMRVALGETGHADKLRVLARINRRLAEREVDAAYVLFDREGQRAVVKEVPVEGEQSASMTASVRDAWVANAMATGVD